MKQYQQLAGKTTTHLQLFAKVKAVNQVLDENVKLYLQRVCKVVTTYILQDFNNTETGAIMSGSVNKACFKKSAGKNQGT